MPKGPALEPGTFEFCRPTRAGSYTWSDQERELIGIGLISCLQQIETYIGSVNSAPWLGRTGHRT